MRKLVFYTIWHPLIRLAATQMINPSHPDQGNSPNAKTGPKYGGLPLLPVSTGAARSRDGYYKFMYGVLRRVYRVAWFSQSKGNTCISPERNPYQIQIIVPTIYRTIGPVCKFYYCVGRILLGLFVTALSTEYKHGIQYNMYGVSVRKEPAERYRNFYNIKNPSRTSKRWILEISVLCMIFEGAGGATLTAEMIQGSRVG